MSAAPEGLQQRLDALCRLAATIKTETVLLALLGERQECFGEGVELSYAIERYEGDETIFDHSELTPGRIITVVGSHQVFHLFLDNPRISSEPIFRSWAPYDEWNLLTD